MKLATLKHSTKRDGELIVVSKDNKRAIKVSDVADNLQLALENWDACKSKLEKIYEDLSSKELPNSFDVDVSSLHSPLPRAYQWLDGSAFIHHIILVRKARNAEPPETLRTVPLMYQGGSDDFLAPTDPIACADEAYGVDLEAEVGVIVGDVPMNTKASDAHKYIRLFVAINDVSLRGLIPAELKQGFGFLQGKPSSAFAPFAITEDELGKSFDKGRINLPLCSEINGKFFGNPDAKEMFFSFYQLIEHAAKTRNLKAGTIIGSGTVSNEDPSRGSSCLAEKRMIEKINTGEIKTEFLKPGDTVKIEMLDESGNNLFGTIFQKVVKV